MADRDPRLQLLDALIEGSDNIEGTEISLGGPASGVWIHTTAQVTDWLKEERRILLETIVRETQVTP